MLITDGIGFRSEVWLHSCASSSCGERVQQDNEYIKTLVLADWTKDGDANSSILLCDTKAALSV